MKYACDIEINQPVQKLIALFDNPENLYQWMEGLQKFEHLSGQPGEVGSKSKLTFLMGKRKMEMIETVTVRNLPEEFSGVYESKSGLNLVTNRFIPISETKTKYVNEQEFQLKGLMKILAPLMIGLFKKQSMKYLVAFKKFAESQP